MRQQFADDFSIKFREKIHSSVQIKYDGLSIEIFGLKISSNSLLSFPFDTL